MTKREALNGKPYAGNPHVRFDEGEVALAAAPRRGSLLYNCLSLFIATLAAVLGGVSGFAAIADSSTVWSYWNHEPADHLRRMSYSRPSVFTLGEWMPEWYERLHGEELISEAASLGIDTVYCHFFKGFGLKHEHAEMLRTKEFVKIARARGVKVLGYCQMNSLYNETMLGEVPELKDWTVRTYEGSVGLYCRQYYRWSPCIESRGFRDYLKKAIRYGIEDVGLDGFHFDNSYTRDCHCERCQKAFRKWLTANIKNPREVLGIADFNHVRLPPLINLGEGGQEWHDPLMLGAFRFRHAQVADFHREIFDYVKSFGGEKIVLHNPAYGRTDFAGRAVDLAVQPASCDFLLAENSRFIRAEKDGSFVTQTVAYKLGRRLGFRVFNSSWPKVRTDDDFSDPRAGIPRDADSMLRFYAEGMIYGDIAGCPWLVRSTKKGAGVILDDPVQKSAARTAFGFYRKHRERLYDTVPVAKAHLLYATDTFYGWTYKGSGFQSFMNAAERLNEQAVTYRIILESDITNLKSGDLLVLPDVRFLSRTLYEAIAAAGDRGVKILPLGQTGQYDENGRERAKDNPIVGFVKVANKVSAIPQEYKVQMSASGIMAETQVNKNGEFVLHLLRPGNTSTIAELNVAFGDVCADGCANLKALNPELFSFDDGCTLAGAKHDAAGCTLRIRNFRTMCSIVFKK